MDLKLAITVLALTISVIGEPVPPGGPKYVPVFVSSNAINQQLNEKEGQNNSAQPNGQDKDHTMYGPPAPVYEHQPDNNNPIYNQQALIPQYQQPIQSQQPQLKSYPVQQVMQNQQSIPVHYQTNQQAAPQPLHQVAQQPTQQAIVVAQQTGSQPIYGNQQQMLQQPLGQQVINPPLYNQQVMAQPMQTQQPNQLLISQPAANQQTILTQPSQPILISQQAPLPNQQAILVHQPNQNGQTLITSNQPINLIQPNNQNPGYNQNQNQNVYAVVPINGQNLTPNQNVGTSTYLVHVQQVPNQVFAMNSG